MSEYRRHLAWLEKIYAPREHILGWLTFRSIRRAHYMNNLGTRYDVGRFIANIGIIKVHGGRDLSALRI